MLEKGKKKKGGNAKMNFTKTHPTAFSANIRSWKRMVQKKNKRPS